MRLVPLALICVGFDLIFVQASASDDINPGKLEFDNGLMNSRCQAKILNLLNDKLLNSLTSCYCG